MPRPSKPPGCGSRRCRRRTSFEGTYLADEIDDPEKVPARDLSKAVRDSAVSGAVLIDKRQLLTNRPTDIHARQPDVEDILRRLEALGALVRDEPVTDAEVGRERSAAPPATD
jgi:hypothetical protein